MKPTMIIITLVVTCLVASCEREEVPILALPAATQTAQNTLGFLLDNHVWTNYGRRCTTFSGCHDNKVTANLYRQPNGNFELVISAGYTFGSKAIDQSFLITTTNVTTSGNYFLDSLLNRRMIFTASRSSQTYKEYENTLATHCILTITKFDTINKIISGSFNGVVHNPFNHNDSTSIQDGRFDSYLDYIR